MTIRNCNEFESQLATCVEDRAPANDDLRAHAATCDVCGPRWEEHLVLERAISEWKSRTPAVNLTNAVVSRWRSDYSKSTPPARSASPAGGRGILAVVVAAVLLMAVTLLARRPGSDSTAHVAKSPPETIANKTLQRPAAPAESDGVNVGEIVSGFRSEYAGWKRDVSTMMAGVKAEWPALRNAAKSPGKKPAQTPTVNRQPRKPSTWQTSLDPIQRDVRKAFDFLKQAMPDFENPSI